jgi:hemerythrin
MADELVAWDDCFLVGNEKIDAQHKELVRMTNEFYAGVQMGGIVAKVFFMKTIQGAVQYIKTHFATEEEVIQNAEYPLFEEHKKQHEDFVAEVGRQIQIFETEDHPDPAGFVKFLMDWVTQHIANSDKKFAPYICRKM